MKPSGVQVPAELFKAKPYFFFLFRATLCHMEVLRLGGQIKNTAEPYNTAMERPDLSLICDL